jgi:hypothetical protein
VLEEDGENYGWPGSVEHNVLHTVKEERNILNTEQRRLTGLVTSMGRNCFLKHIIEGKER